MKVLRITAKPATGFRRCGLHHPAQPVEHPIDAFTAEQIEALKGEPNLVVEEVESGTAIPAPLRKEPEAGGENAAEQAAAAGSSDETVKTGTDSGNGKGAKTPPPPKPKR